jgi:hypothetical protein
MECTAADLSNVQQLWTGSVGGTKPAVVNPTKLFYRPLFSMQGYRAVVDFWISQFGQKPSKILINIEQGLRTSWENLGFQNVDRARYLKHWYVFSTNTLPVANDTDGVPGDMPGDKGDTPTDTDDVPANMPADNGDTSTDTDDVPAADEGDTSTDTDGVPANMPANTGDTPTDTDGMIDGMPKRNVKN